MRVVVAPDKFRGTATAADVVAACSAALIGDDVTGVPMSDGGEGLVDALGGPNRATTVTGPLGSSVDAEWRMRGRQAVIEMSTASGLLLAGGAVGNRPLDATTRGVGELVMEAVESGAREVVVGVGGSATTDGGLGALEAIRPARLGGVELTVVCDVTTRFVDAAALFGPQKGASPPQVELLERRLRALAERYLDEYGVDVASLVGAGAAGGLAGGLAAVGGRLVPGASWVSEQLGVDTAIEAADVAVTGEGQLDVASFEGKVVGHVVALARAAGVPTVIVCGAVDASFDREAVVGDDVEVISLVEHYGEAEAMGATTSCIERAVRDASTMMQLRSPSN